jgi:hypothetical protein
VIAEGSRDLIAYLLVAVDVVDDVMDSRTRRFEQ